MYSFFVVCFFIIFHLALGVCRTFPPNLIPPSRVSRQMLTHLHKQEHIVYERGETSEC